jgi:hypothetical protein
MNADRAERISEKPKLATWWSENRNFVQVVWGCCSLFGTAFFVPAISCACGYMTPTTLPQTFVATVFAWIPFCVPGRKHWATRVLLVMAVIFATAYFGRNLADFLRFSPHAGNW